MHEGQFSRFEPLPVPQEQEAGDEEYGRAKGGCGRLESVGETERDGSQATGARGQN